MAAVYARRRARRDRLELHLGPPGGGALAHHLVVLLHQVAGEVGRDHAGVDRVRVHAAGAEAPLELHGEEHVGGLRLPVGRPLLVGPVLEVDVLEDDGRSLVAEGADRDDARGRSAQERRRDQTGRQEVTQVVRPELELEAVGRLGFGAGHDARVVHEDVEGLVARQEALGEGANARQRVELELLHLDALVAGGLADGLRGRLALGEVAGRDHHPGSLGGQRARRLGTQAARAARHQRELPVEIDSLEHLVGGGVMAEVASQAHPIPPRPCAQGRILHLSIDL